MARDSAPPRTNRGGVFFRIGSSSSVDFAVARLLLQREALGHRLEDQDHPARRELLKRGLSAEGFEAASFGSKSQTFGVLEPTVSATEARAGRGGNRGG